MAYLERVLSFQATLKSVFMLFEILSTVGEKLATEREHTSYAVAVAICSI
jgi:hypothetical protein